MPNGGWVAISIAGPGLAMATIRTRLTVASWAQVTLYLLGMANVASVVRPYVPDLSLPVGLAPGLPDMLLAGPSQARIQWLQPDVRRAANPARPLLSPAACPVSSVETECSDRTVFSKTEFLQHGGLHFTGFVLNHSFDLLSCRTRVPLQELVNGRAALEVFEEGRHGNSRVAKNHSAPLNLSGSRSTAGQVSHSVAMTYS